MAEYFDTAYPKAHFTYYDAAIGGTGSQLAAFRLDRDVLRRKPDLVFLDFSANDGIYDATPDTMASYEALLRRIITEAHAPVVQVIFPFGWDVSEDLAKMRRRNAHIAVSQAYHTAVGDAITLCKSMLDRKATTIAQIWSTDLVHPSDYGYRLFTQAAWQGYQQGVQQKLVSTAPKTMVYADTYTHVARVRISTLYPPTALPQGWRVGSPNLTAAWHDALMSRWLDDEIIATNRQTVKGPNGVTTTTALTPDHIKARFYAEV